MSMRFEGSYSGEAARLGDGAILECKICWWSYDPALGDEMRQIAPGTAFTHLPRDWCCPSCDGPKANFMVVDDGLTSTERARADTVPDTVKPENVRPKTKIAPQAGAMYVQTKAQSLLKAFRDIHNTKMADTHFINRSLHVETIGFRAVGQRVVGVLVTPWCMNLVILPAEEEDWSALTAGEKRVFSFASGDYEFIFNHRDGVGPYGACSLFSPMETFASQLQATDTARSVMMALFDEAHKEAGDRSEDIRAAREARLAQIAEAEAVSETASEVLPVGQSPGQGKIVEKDETPEMSRRFVLTVGMSKKAGSQE